MKYLIVYAHPNPRSFCHAILETTASTLKKGGNQVELRDLYRIGFDLVLKGNDFEALKAGKVTADVNKEQEHIRWAEKIIYIYPLWWLSVPAILKGYIDRVHTLGFAYSFGEKGPAPLLKKKAIIFTTQGGSSEDYEKQGLYKSLKSTIDGSIFEFIGIEVVKHKYFSAVPYVDGDTRKTYLEEVEKTLLEVY